MPLFQPQPQRQQSQVLAYPHAAFNEAPAASPIYRIRYQNGRDVNGPQTPDPKDDDNDNDYDDDDEYAYRARPSQRNSSKLSRYFGASENTPAQAEQAPEKRSKGLGGIMKRLSVSGNRDAQKFKAGW